MKQTIRLSIFLILVMFGLQAEFVELIKITPTIQFDVRYATTNNFTGKKVYPSARCFLQEPAALALDQVQQEFEKLGLGLKVFDAYRPLSVQKIFWAICPNENYVADPAKGSRHNRGCAVDLTLIDLKTGKELVMPSAFDEFSDKAGRNYDKMEPDACKNCKLLESIMKKHGFEGLPSEWWHFDFVGANPKEEVWKAFPISDVDIEKISAPSKKNTHDLVNIKDINPTIATNLIFATPNNFTGQIIYPSSECYMLREVAEKLDIIQKELAPMGLGLLIIGAYRPLSAQQKFWDLIHDDRYVSNPAKNGGRHTRGTAVDVLLIDLKTGKELALPIKIDDLKDKSYFSEKVHHGYMNLPAEQIKNREFLKNIMIEHGFEPLATEFWHYDIRGWQSYPVIAN